MRSPMRTCTRCTTNIVWRSRRAFLCSSTGQKDTSRSGFLLEKPMPQVHGCDMQHGPPWMRQAHQQGCRWWPKGAQQRNHLQWAAPWHVAWEKKKPETNVAEKVRSTRSQANDQRCICTQEISWEKVIQRINWQAKQGTLEMGVSTEPMELDETKVRRNTKDWARPTSLSKPTESRMISKRRAAPQTWRVAEEWRGMTTPQTVHPPGPMLRTAIDPRQAATTLHSHLAKPELERPCNAPKFGNLQA